MLKFDPDQKYIYDQEYIQLIKNKYTVIKNIYTMGSRTSPLLRFKLLTEGCKLLTEILIPSGK